MPANALITKDSRQRQPRSGDAFDVSGLVDADAERRYLAGLLDVLNEQPLEARELASLVESPMLVADGTGEVHAAIREVVAAEQRPTRMDVLVAIKRRAAVAGRDELSDPTRHLFLELLEDKLATGWQAARLSRQAAADVADLHRRRRGILLAADYVIGLRHGGSDGVSQVVAEMQAVRLEGPGRGVVTFAEAVDEWSRHERVPTVRTLLEPFDRATEGVIKLKLITNRGVKVWPEGFPETFCTDHWRCRFVAPTIDIHEAGATYTPIEPTRIVEALRRAGEAGIEVVKTENLYLFDGVRGFSLGQGE